MKKILIILLVLASKKIVCMDQQEKQLPQNSNVDGTIFTILPYLCKQETGIAKVASPDGKYFDLVIDHDCMGNKIPKFPEIALDEDGNLKKGFRFGNLYPDGSFQE
jgi:hypothetical protein